MTDRDGDGGVREPTAARDALLDRWVEQPPVGPNVQYLRDAERRAALARVGGADRVLDVASEANVTRGLAGDAAHVTRVDFSPAAADRARELLGGAVDRFATADPDEPALSFVDGTFDAAVAVGPYDWPFLDVAGLTAEVGRVLDADGRFVLTVPTPRSPYAVLGRGRHRYFEPAGALDLLSPGWAVEDADQLFQYPSPLHHLLNRLPDRTQESFAAAAHRASDRLSGADAWSLASYLVLDARPLPYADSLDAGVAALFRPADENGFWDRERGTFLRALEYEPPSPADDAAPTGDLNWSRDDGVEWRYGPFALMGAVEWRTSALGTDAHDARLRAALDGFAARLADGTVAAEMPSYGVGPLIDAFARAGTHDAFDDGRLATARELAAVGAETAGFDHAEDALVLYGWATLYDRDPDAGDGRLRERIDRALFAVADRLAPDGFLAFDNHTTRRHQNQMYALWGLCRAVEATGADGYLGVAERVLDATLDRRMRPDGAFRWEDVPRRARLKGEAAKRLGYWPEHWEYLFACHQTFFVNAVAAYYAAGGEGRYDQAVGRAMAWVYGDNPRGEDLVAASSLGVPLRQTTLDGRIGAPHQSFKGSYEVGSWLLALTRLCDPAGPFEPAPAVHTAGSEGSSARDAWLPHGGRLGELLRLVR